MKLLKNECDYRAWYFTDFRPLCDEDWDLIGADRVQHELLLMSPLFYPCIACILSRDNPYDKQYPYYIYRDQLRQWILEMQ